MTVAEMKRRMSGREFTEWMAYDTVEAEDRTRSDLAATARANLAARQRRPARARQA